MEANNNTLQWPSIEQLPREVCHRMDRFFAVAELAATVIQRRTRGQSSPLIERPPIERGRSFAGGNRHALHHWLMASPVAASEKYDGTNVGKLQDGTLLGRRLVIEASATSYQRCELSGLRSLGTHRALDELAGHGRPLRAALFGELMINAGLYSYTAKGLAKTWVAFGALLEFETMAAARGFVESASAAGLVCGLSGEFCVRITNSEAFGALLTRHGVPVVAASSFPSLCEAVARKEGWMASEQGEGLVLSVATARGKASLYKWKISREPQPAAVSELRELLEALRGGADGKAALLDAEIHQMIERLYAVATHVDSTLAPAPGNGAKPPKPVKACAIDPAAVARAIASALTKFDALESTFEAEGKGALTTLAERLGAEVVADPDLALPLGDAALREVTTSVKRHIGQAYGAWLKSRAGDNTPAAA